MVEINSGLDFNAIIKQTFLRPVQLLQTLKPTFNRLQSYNYKLNHHEFFVEHKTFGENPRWEIIGTKRGSLLEQQLK